MLDFEFYNPTRLIFGQGKIRKLSDLIDKNKKVLVLSGGGSVVKNGTMSEVLDALSGYQVHQFSGIESNPLYETLLKAVDLVKKEQIDFLLAVGGGSVIDGTKFVAMAVFCDGDPWDNIINNNKPKQALPLGIILTIPATGSEMNQIAVISRASSLDKLSFRDELVYPKFSIVDPTKTYSVPKNNLANGLVDSFVHVMEQYMTYPVNTKVTDYYAEGIAKTLMEIAPDVITKPDDYQTKANFLWAATNALNGILSVGVPTDWTTHRIGHELTALFGLDHGKTLSIILPAVWKVRKQQKKEKLLQFAKNVLNLEGTDEQQLLDLTINTVKQFFESLDMPTSLSACNINKQDIDKIILNLEKHKQTALGEHQDIDLSISRQILEEAL